MDTRFLESYVTVIEHGSIAEAARRLNLTPAAVAQRIHALERDMGTQLLVRSGRTVKPTEAGFNIISQAKQLLHNARDLKAIANDQTGAGELRLGAIATALNGLLPDVFAALSKPYPLLSIYVAPGTSESLYPQVLSGELDAAVIVQPEFAIPKTCGWTTLRQEPLIVLAPSTLATHDPIEALKAAPFIRYDRNAVGGRIADRYLRNAGIQTQDRFELTSLTAIALLVDRGLGVSLVPEWAPPWPEGLSLKKMPIGDHAYVRRLGLIWNQASARLRWIKIFLEKAEAISVNEAGDAGLRLRSSK
jgi:DNA-binding transcriptional LysR family regulator